MAVLVILALIAGICCGMGGLSGEAAAWISGQSDWVLMLLMFSVGLSVGSNRDIFRRLRKMDLRVWMVPVGVIAGSLAGGALCGLILPLGLRESVSVGAGMGWYSLSGVMLTDFYGAEVGAVAFMSNLLRAGATSEDTTLPILMRHASAEMVVYSVINGVLTSAAVPVLLRLLR